MVIRRRRRCVECRRRLPVFLPLASYLGGGLTCSQGCLETRVARQLEVWRGVMERED